MTHPSLEAIVDGSARDHVERCAACQQLAAMAGVPVAPREPADADDLDQLGSVDDRAYTDWSALPDAQGGMGQVFRARDRRLGRYVAIKQLRPGLGDAERAILVKRFEREAWLTARLQHPAIVGVHEAGRFANGEPFYAMPLLRGRPLAAEIAARPELRDRLALLANLTTIAEAIAYAHEQGIVHRDIKPDNILVGGFGETVVIDWGLAKDISDQGGADDGAYRAAPVDGLTQFGVGTASYMPPEQARGDDPDPLVDVYALGATLYHLLAGAPPFAGQGASAIRRALADGAKPRALRDVVAEVPPELADIVAHAMAIDRAARLPSARELARELRRYQTGQLLASRQYTAGELIRRWMTRHRTPLVIGAAATAAVIALGVVAFVRVGHERDRAAASARASERALHRSQGVVASRDAADPAKRADALVLAIGAVGAELDAPGGPPPEAMQGLTDALTLGAPVVALAHAGVIKRFAAAGDRVVGVDDARAIVVWDARTGARLATYPSELPQPEWISLSPDGTRAIVCGYDPIVETFDLATGAHASAREPVDLAGCAWLADGRAIVAATDVSVRDATTLAVVARFPLAAPASSVATGKLGAAVTTTGGDLWTWRGGGDAPIVRPTGAALGQLSRFDRTGETLYQVGADRVVRAFAFAGGAAREIARGDGAQIATVSPSAADDRVAIGAWDQDGARHSEVVWPGGAAGSLSAGSGSGSGSGPGSTSGSGSGSTPLDGSIQSLGALREPAWAVVEHVGPIAVADVETGGVVVPLTGHAQEATTIAFANGGRIATASRDGAAYLWDVTAPGLWLGHSGEIVAIAVSPSGDRVMTASHDGSVRVWDAATGSKLTRSPGDREITAAVWLDDERIVAGDLGGRVRVIAASMGATITSRTLPDPISAIAVGPNGAYAAGTLGGGLAVGKLGAGLEIGTMTEPIATGSAITALAAAQDGWVASHADGTTRRWSTAASPAAVLATRPEPAPVDLPGDHEGDAALVVDGADLLAVRPAGDATELLDATALAIHATIAGRVVAAHAGRRLVALPDGTARITASPPDGVALVGHRGSITAGALSADGAFAATASVDGTVRIWDAAHTAPAVLVVAPTDLGLPTAIAFARDALVIGYASGAVRAVALTPRAALARGCTIARNLGRAADVAPYCK